MKHTLSNGMNVLLINNPQAQVVTLQGWIKFGAADESDDIAGIAHVFEHLLFKGTETRKVGQIAQEIEALGGELNAYTSYDQTVMFMTLPSSHWKHGLDVLADSLLHSVVDESEMQKEKEVILEEIKRYKDMPATLVNENLRKKLFNGHPYARPVIGYDHVVKNLTRDEIMKQYKTHYHAKNMFLVLCGNLNEKETLDECEKKFSGLKSLNNNHSRPELVALTECSSHFVNYNTPDHIWRLGWQIPNATHGDTPALDAYALILGQGESSKLNRKIVFEKELLRSIGSDAWTPKNNGCFSIGMLASKGSEKKFQ